MKKILIIGAGEGGKRLLGEIKRSRKNFEVVGFVDDNKKLNGVGPGGLKILGATQELKEIAAKYLVVEIFIAIPSLKGDRLKKIIDQIKETELTFKILPGVFESIEYLTNNCVPAGKLRQVELSDLLNREEIKIDLAAVSSYLEDKVVLITGAGGSIGSELARQITEFSPKKLILLDIYENNLYEQCGDLSVPYELIIADIKDKKSLERIFRNFRPNIIFHAAAHKHVPLMEKEPREAIKNNVLGTANLTYLATKYRAERFVFISTDKAVNPTSVMGATKRFCENQILSLNHSETTFAIVRFGNVLASFGSVVPLWQKQLALGKPLTVTHPEMKRFFMTIPEAVQLVIQAAAMAKNVEIFALKMGKQYKIIDLARDFLKLSGRTFDTDSSILITKPRPGEKLVETLHEEKEILKKSKHPMVVKIVPEEKNFGIINNLLTKFKKRIDSMTQAEIVGILREAVPTYTPYQVLEKPKKSEKRIEFSPPTIGKEEIETVKSVLESGWLTMGKKVIDFEKQFAKFHQVKNAIALNSATAGLHLALLSLGIGAGDEVILPSYTFASCANTVVWTGAKPVFVDVLRDSFLVDPEDIERKITRKTKAIMVVHFGGQMAEMDEIFKIAKNHKLKIIEDCAHSPGAKYRDKLAGTIGEIGVFSFYANKNITTGDGGMIITNHSDLAEKIKILRLHGMSKDAYNRYSDKGDWFYEISQAGFKYNMTDMAAALGIEQLKKLNKFNLARCSIAQKYFALLKDIPDLILPSGLPHRENVWHLFPVRVPPEKRSQIIEGLKSYNIIASVHFIPLHLQSFYQKKYGYQKGGLPVSEELFSSEISLPIYPHLTFDEIKYIAKTIRYLMESV